MSRTKEECDRLGLAGGTGLLQFRRVLGTDIIMEIGRGLNEGYTEWMCEKLGHKPRAYKTLTNFIRLLEAARGTENVMLLGKCDLVTALGIPAADINTFFSIADSVYKTEDIIAKYNDISDSLNKDYSYLSDDIIEKRKRMYAEYGPDIEEIRSDVAFLAWVKENNADISDESVRKYLIDVKVPGFIESRDILVAKFESMVIEKYFLKDLDQIFLDDTHIDESNIHKIEQIVSFLNSREMGTNSKHLCKDMTACVTIEKFENLKIAYIKQIAREELTKYKNGDLPLRDCIKRIKPYIGNDNTLTNIFIGELMRGYEPAINSSIYDIMELGLYADINDDIFEKIAEAEVYTLSTSNGETGGVTTSAIYGDGVLIDRYHSERTIDKNSDSKFSFDYTSDRDEDLQLVVRKFEALRAEILQKYPDAVIHIAQRMIVVDTKEEESNLSFYYVSDNDITPMYIREKEKLNFSAGEKDPEKERSMVPINIKSSFISNLITKVKIKIHKMKTRRQMKMPVNYNGDTPGQITLQTRPHSGIEYLKVSKEQLNQADIKTEQIEDNESITKEAEEYNQNR